MKRRDYIYLAGLFLLSVFISLQNVCSPISQRLNYSDSSIYQYIGHLICEGKMPYLDAFDHKGPILYLINALSLLGGIRGIWVIDAVLMISYAYLCFIITKRFISSGWAFVVSAIAVTALVNTYWIGNTPDWYCTQATLFCMYIFVKYFQDGILRRREMFLIGVAVAFCFWQKFTTIGVIGCLCLGVLFADYFSNRNNAVFRINCIAFCLSGFFTVSIPVLVWLWRGGALIKMFESYFLFSTSYGTSEVLMREKLTALSYFLQDPFVAAALVSIVLFAFSIWLLKSTKFVFSEQSYSKNAGEDTTLMTISCISLLLQAIVNAMAGRSYLQYKSILYPCALLEICIFLKFILKLSDYRKMAMQALCFVAVCMLLFNINKAVDNQAVLTQHDTDVVAAIKEKTTDNFLIAVASPDHCGLYLWTNTESATTYPYIQADMYGDMEFWEEYNRQLQESSPTVIAWNNNWNKDKFLSAELLDNYDTATYGRIDLLVKKENLEGGN